MKGLGPAEHPCRVDPAAISSAGWTALPLLIVACPDTHLPDR